ncbi:hypothetical protein PATA110616_21820 [Paenibacillus tarimensis]
MSDITEFSIRSTLARHSHEHTIVTIDHANVVNYKFIVNGDGGDSLHSSFGIYTAESNIGYLHFVFTTFAFRRLGV